MTISRAHETATTRNKTCAQRRRHLTLLLAASLTGLIVQIIKLILAQAGGKAQAKAAAERAALKAELEQLGLKEVRLRAVAEGVDEDAIEDARDGDAPKECIIELILAKKTAAAHP